MAQLLVRNKSTNLICTNNLDHEMEWDSDEMLFLVQYDDKVIQQLEYYNYRMHSLVPEIIVWSKSLDFQTTYIARKEDFDYLEMF